MIEDEISLLKQQRDQLRTALVALVGSEREEDLKAMKAVLRIAPVPNADKIAMLNAIDILLKVPHDA